MRFPCTHLGRWYQSASDVQLSEKVRGDEELNDNFRIEFEDYELQQEEMEEGFTCCITRCMGSLSCLGTSGAP
jgi:hypothetical protein